MRYAMIETKNNRVIEIMNGNPDNVPKMPPLVDGTTIKAIECDDLVYRGLYYIGGEFIEIAPEPQPEPELSATEQAIFEIQVNTEYIADLLKLNS